MKNLGLAFCVVAIGILGSVIFLMETTAMPEFKAQVGVYRQGDELGSIMVLKFLVEVAILVAITGFFLTAVEILKGERMVRRWIGRARDSRLDMGDIFRTAFFAVCYVVLHKDNIDRPHRRTTKTDQIRRTHKW